MHTYLYKYAYTYRIFFCFVLGTALVIEVTIFSSHCKNSNLLFMITYPILHTVKYFF